MNSQNRLFEIPYNFDFKLIDTFKELDTTPSSCFTFYVPAYIRDYTNILRGNNDQIINNFSRADYVKHIEHILSLYPNKVQLLLQRQNEILSKDQLKFYLDLGINKFCVGSIKQADILKDIDSDFDITGSITMDISKDMILKNKKDYQNLFNNFVLNFKFNRDFDKIKEITKLPFNFIILVNSQCNIHCNGHVHWDKINSIDVSKTYEFCPNLLRKNNSWFDQIVIRPLDLPLFDPYIKIYKLQDRAYSTQRIISEFIVYNFDYTIYPEIKPNINLYKK